MHCVLCLIICGGWRWLEETGSPSLTGFQKLPPCPRKKKGGTIILPQTFLKNPNPSFLYSETSGHRHDNLEPWLVHGLHHSTTVWLLSFPSSTCHEHTHVFFLLPNFTFHPGAGDFWSLALLSLTWGDQQVYRVTGTWVQDIPLVLSRMCLLNSVWKEIFSLSSFTGPPCSLYSRVERSFARYC